MADTEVRIPRRKKGAKFHPKEAPFPVPIQSVTGKPSCNDRWFYYTGYFRDNCVVIEDLGDLTFLYKMGFFGKGFLSRSKPEYEVISNISQKAFSKSEKLRRLPPREREIRQSKFRVVRKERFKNHSKWWEQANAKCLSDENIASTNDISDDLETTEDPLVEEDKVTSHKRRKVDVTLGDDSLAENQPVNQRDGQSVNQPANQPDIGPSSDQPETYQDDSDTAEVTMHSSDDEDIRDNNSEDDTEASITNRELEEVMQDVMRKSNQHKFDAVTEEAKQRKQKTSGTRKDDPYKVYEHLQLSLEEAFFLSYGLGCLSVLNDNKKPMSLGEMWCSFCLAKQDFIPSYVTYHYFRSKGWVPKIGIKYGTDWVLYKEGMPFYHSSYSVIAQMVESPCLETDGRLPCRQLTWPQLCGVSRVSGHAAKEVMVCYVIKPSDMTKEEMMSPNCIAKFKTQGSQIPRAVFLRGFSTLGSRGTIEKLKGGHEGEKQEVVLRRWIPERAREPDKERS